MNSILPLLSLGILTLTALPIASAKPWKKHIIQPASDTRGFTNTAVANDWDGDGNIDVAASFNGTVTLVLGPDWKSRVVLHAFASPGGKPGRLASGGCIHSTTLDVDRDGDLDFIGSKNTVFWLECPDDATKAPWTYRTVDDEILGTHCLITGDVDGDGVLDLIANSGRGPKNTEIPFSLTWQAVPKNPHEAPNWTRHVFADRDAPGGSHYTGFGDVNGDGRPDISCAAKGGENFPDGEWFAWWEQPADATKTWKKHLLAGGEPGATNIIPVDLNGDEMTDFAATRGHGKGVLWFRGPKFDLIDIDKEIAGPHSLALGDIDGNGTTDIATCGRDADGVAAWYANDGKGNFIKHTVAVDQGSYDLRLVDMDGDKDLDFLIAGHASTNIVWLENPKP